MFLRRAALLLLIVAVLSSFAAAKPSTTKNKDDFKACGGAKKCLGVARLERIRRRSGVDHKSVDAIAAQIDEDGDLVSHGLLSRGDGVRRAFTAARMVLQLSRAGGTESNATRSRMDQQYYRGYCRTSVKSLW